MIFVSLTKTGPIPNVVGENQSTCYRDAMRVSVQNKLIAIHELIKDDLRKLGRRATSAPDSIVSSAGPVHHTDGQLRSMWLTYGRRTAGQSNLLS